VAGEGKSFEFLLFCGEKDNQLVSKKKISRQSKKKRIISLFFAGNDIASHHFFYEHLRP